MDSTGQLHPNWRALATIHLPLKRFVREGAADQASGARDERGRRYEIENVVGEEVKAFYESITQEESGAKAVPTAEANRRASRRENFPKRKEVKAQKKPFDEVKHFRFATENNAQALGEVHYQADEINTCDAYGWSALMMAACAGAEESVKTLLHLGASRDLKDKSGKTALDLARIRGHWNTVQLLENSTTTTDDQDVDEHADDEILEAYYCDVCQGEFKETSYRQHLTSTLHQFNAGPSVMSNKLQKFNIPPRNRGLQLMVKQGWDKESGLGPSSSGRLYPVKTVIRKQRTGLGIDQAPARVTHFEAFDLSATKSTYYKKKPRNRNDMRREKHREWKRERRLRKELS